MDDMEEDTEMREEESRFNETYVESLEEEEPIRGADKDKNKGENDIKILIATDIHVGYGETKPVINMDSVNTLEEVLQIAVKEEVDMILLGGDLFHENNPSRDMMCKVVRLLRKYCLNDRDVLLEFVSDPSVNFSHSNFARVNYEDSNLNVGLPIFTIHGNHDDMAAKGLTALDELHESGLINLFGKFEECESFEVSPILLRKGTTRLALYGIGSQRDDRLNRAFESAAIKFLRPRADSEGWFNLIALHQNRPPRSVTRTTGNYLPVKYIPSFFDVVLWGHEHECKIQPEYVDVSAEMAGDGFFIIQPGSTVATSLTAEEALPKHVTVLTIRGRKFQSRPIKLETTRQMFVETLVLDSLPSDVRLPPNGSRPDILKDQLLDEILVKEKVRKIVEKAKETRGARQPKLPLVRINILYSGPWAHMTAMNGRSLGVIYAEEVANPTTIINTKKKKKEKGQSIDPIAHFSAIDPSNTSVEDIVSEYFQSVPFEDKLCVMTDNALKAALHIYASQLTAVAANRKLDEAIEERVTTMEKKLAEMQMKKVKEGDQLDESIEDSVRLDLMAMKRMLYSDRIPRRGTRDPPS